MSLEEVTRPGLSLQSQFRRLIDKREVAFASMCLMQGDSNWCALSPTEVRALNQALEARGLAIVAEGETWTVRGIQ